MLMSMNRCPPPRTNKGVYRQALLCYNSFALPDVDVVCSKETATGLPRFEKGQDRPSCKQWERKRLTNFPR